jgi:hypothetical protein
MLDRNYSEAKDEDEDALLYTSYALFPGRANQRHTVSA